MTTACLRRRKIKHKGHYEIKTSQNCFSLRKKYVYTHVCVCVYI